jgi:hypothetical protein
MTDTSSTPQTDGTENSGQWQWFVDDPEDPLLGPQLKLERARRLMDEFDAAFDDFKKSQTRKDVPELNADRRYYEFKFRMKQPTRLAPIVGDIIHNLRSALDLLACDLARMNGRTSRTAMAETWFPIFGSEAEFRNGADKKIRHLSPADQEIIRALKPYKGGNDTLWQLHQLDILDKHRLILPAVLAVSVTDVLIGPVAGEGKPRMLAEFNAKLHREGVLKDGDVLFRVPASVMEQPTEIEMKATLNVVFSETKIVDGEPVRGTLIRFGKAVQDVIKAFEA